MTTIGFSTADAIANKTHRERQDAYRKTTKGERARQREWQSRAKRAYLDRPFVGWDGEGVNRDDGTHDYVLLASSAGDVIHSPNALLMPRIFETVLARAAADKNAIHVVYGASYDFNMWFAGLTESELRLVHKSRYPVDLHGYRVKWRPGKQLWISDGNRSVTVFDVISFFQCSFVKACDKYLGDDWHERATIVEQKANRADFDYANLDDIVYYNGAELVNLVRLMQELRLRLNKVGLNLSRWDGPGAIAAKLLTNQGVKNHKDKGNVPDATASAARHAYAGGRFEVIRFGAYDGPVFAYDINSAYPSAMRHLPSLAGGHWQHRIGDAGSHPYALYRVRWRGADMRRPGPLFFRHENGTISYPVSGEGWYWSPEVDACRAYAAMDSNLDMEIVETWTFRPATDGEPFAFVEPLFNKRKALKKAGDGAELGLKLALNSLYGKLAQQVGWVRTKRGDVRIPPFHQLEWAGFVTSHARAQVFMAAMHNLDAIVAFETDAVFSLEPLPLRLGDGLGEWGESRFSDCTYVQSGVYFATAEDGTTFTNKTRGVDLGNLTRADVEAKLLEPNVDNRFVRTELTRFVGAGLALLQDFGRWRRWETFVKEVTLAPTGKREHFGCELDGHGPGDAVISPGMHYTVCPFMACGMSAEFPVQWINPNPEMTELTVLRLEHYEEREYD